MAWPIFPNSRASLTFVSLFLMLPFSTPNPFCQLSQNCIHLLAVKENVSQLLIWLTVWRNKTHTQHRAIKSFSAKVWRRFLFGDKVQLHLFNLTHLSVELCSQIYHVWNTLTFKSTFFKNFFFFSQWRVNKTYIWNCTECIISNT